MSVRWGLGRGRLLLVLTLLLGGGFMATSLASYHVSRQAIREAIISRELPLASSHIQAEIQKDLVRTVLISSTMASDTFVRDWVLQGERTPQDLSRYLAEVKTRFGAVSSFFVSERTRRYYTGEGILKEVSPSEPRDRWYFRVRDLSEPYEVNFDPDLANADTFTVFINYRVLDFSGRYIGATGIGLAVDSVRRTVADYQQRFQRTIYFVDARGHVVPVGPDSGGASTDLRDRPGLGELVDRILAAPSGAYEYQVNGHRRLLHVTALPELKWYLFVEKDERDALEGVRHTLNTNLALSFVLMAVVLGLTHLVLRRYQRRIEDMAVTDKLTGLLNRQAFDLLMGRLVADLRRRPEPVAVLLVDIDDFKAINDRHGHLVGDRVLQGVATLLKQRMRASDIAARWGGEEFLLVVKACGPQDAAHLAESLRAQVAQSPIPVREGAAVPVTISIGVSGFAADEAIEAAIARADAGLYEAKRSGRNQVRVGPSSRPAPGGAQVGLDTPVGAQPGTQSVPS